MIRNSTSEISIKPKASTTSKMIIFVVAVMTIIAMMYFSYSLGMRSGNSRYGQDAVLIEQLNESIEKQQGNLQKTEQQIIFAERQQQIQEEAYKQMSAAYASSEQKNSYLVSRLDFYRSIISPEGGQSGPAIQAIDYYHESVDGDSNIAFDVTLVQAINHKVNIAGDLIIELYSADGLVKTWPESGSLSVNYQYFQRISGVFEAVPTLENARIKVVLSLHDGTSVEKMFDVDINQLYASTNQSS